MLHLIFKSPITEKIFHRTECGDALVLIGDPVYSSISGSEQGELLVKWTKSRGLYLLSEDIEARGISIESICTGIEVLNYSDFLALTLQHEVIKSWN